eukprot:XP_016658175.1 PREDICTED: uncharacterized protein LOC107883158 isoform X1 [Acyrthosiphon pisum]
MSPTRRQQFYRTCASVRCHLLAYLRYSLTVDGQDVLYQLIEDSIGFFGLLKSRSLLDHVGVKVREHRSTEWINMAYHQSSKDAQSASRVHQALTTSHQRHWNKECPAVSEVGTGAEDKLGTYKAT